MNNKQRIKYVNTLLSIINLERQPDLKTEKDWLYRVCMAITNEPCNELKDFASAVLKVLNEVGFTEIGYKSCREKIKENAFRLLKPLVKDEIEKLYKERKSLENRLNDINFRLQKIGG